MLNSVFALRLLAIVGWGCRKAIAADVRHAFALAEKAF